MKSIVKCRILLLAAIMLWCIFPKSVHAEEYHSHCYPTEKQIQEYKEDGTWEERQEYVKKLNHATPSEELLYKAFQRENGFVTYAAGDDIPEEWKGMQVTGDAKMLLVRVEFADVKFEDSKIYSEEEFYNMVMGDESTGAFPYESLNAYYKRSSYNKLNITSDQVYSCTLSKNREEYEWEDLGEQDLLKEVFEMLDSTVDFTDYDANNDGRLDSVCINFAGENTGWGSTWWSHKYDFLDSSIMYDGIRPAGYIFLETDIYDKSYATQTLIHETGHLLGLPDYYSQTSDGIGTTDMMNNNRGDHNGFSKWLLGWIDEENILRLNKESGNTQVELSPLASEKNDSDKLIAVIAPEDISIYSEYYVVQYDEYMGNQSVFELEYPAYRIFHVDAHLNDEGTDFQYNNMYAYERFLIKAASVVEGEYGAKRYYYGEEDAFTPDTNESSAFYGGNILGFTGIELTDFKTGDNPSFNVSFREKEVVDGKLEFQILGETPLNMMELTLLSNKPLIDAGTYQQAYLEDSDGNQYFLDMYFEEGTQKIETSYINIVNSLKPETEYTLVIPEGMFQVDVDVYSEECRLTVQTGKFPEIEADYSFGPESSTDVFSLDDTRAGFLRIVDYTDEIWNAKLHVYEETEEVEVIDFTIPIPASYSEIMDMKAVTCYDGTIAVAISSGNPVDYNSMNSFYKIDQNGNVLAGPFSMVEKLNFFPVGTGVKGIVENSGALGAPDIENELKLEIYTIDFENEPTSRLINANKYMSNVTALDEESYIVLQDSEYGYSACIFNQEDELITSMDLSTYIEGFVCSAVKTGDNLAVLHSYYLESGEYAIAVSEFDMEGSYLGTHEVVICQEWKSIDGWKFAKTSWGYGLYNHTDDQPYNIYFLNDEFELISSLQVPDTLCDGSYMGTRGIVKWYDLTTWGYRIAITEPLLEESTEVTPKPDKPSDEESDDKGDVSKPDKPSQDDGGDADKPSKGNGTEDKDTPKTGDDNNLVLICAVIIISGGIIVRSLKRKLRYNIK